MKKLVSLLLIAVFVPTLFLTGCRKYDDEPIVVGQSDYEVLTEYLVNNDMDIDDIVSDWIVGRPAAASDVNAFIAGYDILDFRQPADFDEGHIDGAVNVNLGNLLEKAAATTKPILAVCYTGQTASLGVIALRLSGYADAKVLKFGMDGWNTTLTNSGKWTTNSSDQGYASTNWLAPADINLATDTTYDAPEFDATATDGAGILAERVDAMLAGGFKGIGAATVLASPNDYFINNFWDLTDVETHGHIAGAHRIKPLTIEGGQISNINPDEQIVTYCWTGQTSSMITAYLNVLGYDAISLTFGANSMIHSELGPHMYNAPAEDYPIVSTK